MIRRTSHAPRLLALVTTLCFGLGIGPCGPIPGGQIAETTSVHPVVDWSFANDANKVPHCVLEVRPESPRSMTVNCMSWQGSLFVSCSSCAAKRWAKMVIEDPRGRVEVGERIYPVRLTRVVDATRLDAVWRARARKLGNDEETPRKEGWWTFELESR